MKYILTVLVLFPFIMAACSKEDKVAESACAATPKSFSADVNAIIQSSCSGSAGCHGAGSVNGPGPLLTYNQIFNARSFIHNSVSTGRMPKNGSLSAAQKASILCWIDNGAANN